MKRFMKGCGIAALLMCAVGVVLVLVAVNIKGSEEIGNTVEKLTGGKVHLAFGDGRGWGAWFGRMGSALGNVHYGIGDATEFNKNYEILSGDIEKFSPGNGSEIHSLRITAGGCTFVTADSGDDNFYLEAERTGKLQAYVEEGTLHVIQTTASRYLDDLGEDEVTLYIPKDFWFSAVDVGLGAGVLKMDKVSAGSVAVSVGAGQVEANSLYAEELELAIGAGQIKLDDMQAGEFTAELSMGELIAQGAINGDASVKCSMGNAELALTGEYEDYNYEVEGAMGNIDIGESSYGGMAHSRTIDNGADRTIDVSGSMGNISIQFSE